MNKMLIIATSILMFTTSSVFAGTIFDGERNKIGTCKGSTCIVDDIVYRDNGSNSTNRNVNTTGDNTNSNVANGGDTKTDQTLSYTDNSTTLNAPALISSNDTCMGSTSTGVHGPLIGFSFGTNWTDNDCITRKDARFIHNTGHRTVALSLMCGKESVRAAVARAGTPEQRAACSITDDEIDSYRAKPIIVSVDRVAPPSDED